MLDQLIIFWFIIGIAIVSLATFKSNLFNQIWLKIAFLLYLLTPMIFGSTLMSLIIATGSIWIAFLLHRLFYSNPVLNLFSVFILWLPFEFELYETSIDTELPITFAMIILVFYSIYFIFSNQNNDFFDSYRLSLSDFKIAVTGFIMLVLTIVPIGIGIGFLNFNLFEPSVGFFLNSLLVGYFLVALPEELLFRYLMTKLLHPFINRQSLLLIVTAVIFGLAHLNNQAIGFNLNWGYAGLATIAGLGYGWVFFRTNKVAAAALTHMLINFTWALFFNSPY